MRNPRSTIKNPLSAFIPRPSANTFAQQISQRLKEILKPLKSFDGKLSRGEVHRLRVGLRRLAAIFEVLNKVPRLALNKKAQRAVKFLTNELGEVRSLDVSLKLWRRQFSSPWIESELKSLAREAHRDLAKKVGKKPSVLLVKAIQNIVTTLGHCQVPLEEAWEDRLAAAERRAFRDYSRYSSFPRIENLHQLRIRLKQWRYLLELDEPGGEGKDRIETFKRLQDDIGDLHDREVLWELFKKKRMKRLARKRNAGAELKEIRRGLKAEIEAGQIGFPIRHREVLDRIFPKEKA